MTLNVIPCNAERFDELFQFVVRLNADAAHHIGYFGVGETAVREAFEESNIPSAEGFRIAYENGKLVGALGVDADPEIRRVWILGPFVEHANWHGIADALYEAAQPVIPSGEFERELFCDAQNANLHEFAIRHGFTLRSESAIMFLPRSHYRRAEKESARIFDFESSYFEQFQSLHDKSFPRTYMTAAQMIAKRDERHRLFIAAENGNLLGYVFGKIEAESGYVDFLATEESFRRRGVGADLLARALEWMFAESSTQRVNLTVNTNSAAALSLYNKFGFITERVTRGYRKNAHV